MPCMPFNIVYIVGYFIGYRGISLSIVHIVLYSVASNLRQMHNHFEGYSADLPETITDRVLYCFGTKG